MATRLFRVLTLDGGGSKGLFTVGVLEELEQLADQPLGELFDLVYGTSTGAIIATLVCLGYRPSDIRRFYLDWLPDIMRGPLPGMRSAALREAASNMLKASTFADIAMPLGIVAADLNRRKPIIFKSTVDQAHGRKASFEPGFGATLVDALMASTAAIPFFAPASVATTSLGEFTAIDGGFVANNPTLYAIADAVHGLGLEPSQVCVLNIGVGSYPIRENRVSRLVHLLPSVSLLERTLQINSASMTELVSIVFGTVDVVRIDSSIRGRENATSLLERDSVRLERLVQFGRDAFGHREEEVRRLLRL